MHFPAFWSLKESRSWHQSVSWLIRNLESSGCELESRDPSGSNRKEYEILIPGLDFHLLRALREMSIGSPLEQDWIRVMQRGLWDRAELKIEVESSSLRCRWIYWSPAQIFLHGVITLLFAIEAWSLHRAEGAVFRFVPLLLGFSLAHLLPAGLAYRESRKLRAIFIESGFQAR